MADARVRAAPARLLTAGSGRVRLVDDETGDPFMMTELATHLDQSGHLDDARQWWRRSAEAGAVSAMLHLANDLEHDGELGEAEMWLRRATEAGVHDGLAVLARFLRRNNREDEADQLPRFGIDPGGATAAAW